MCRFLMLFGVCFRRVGLGMVVLGCFFGALSADAGIKGRNAMGSVRVDIFPGKWHLLSLPFTNPDGSGVTTVLDLFPDVLLFPTGTVVAFFDNGNQQFHAQPESRAFFGWSPGTLNLEERPFWLFVPDVGQVSPFFLYMRGDVPDVDRLPVMSQSVFSMGLGNNFISYGYPALFDFVGSSLADQAQIGDTLIFYDPEVGYTASASRAFFGWSPSSFHMIPGYGYFYHSDNDLTWQEPKPYTYP